MSTFDCDGNITAPHALSIFTASTSCVTAFLGTIGNSLIICVVLFDPLKKLHTPFNYFIVNLSVSDLVVGAVFLPISVYAHILESLGELHNNIAYAFHISFFISITASILNLIALTVDRYVAITFPMKYRKYLSWKRCFAISCGIWIFALTVPLAYLESNFVHFLMICANAGIFVALVTFIVTYVRIFQFLKTQTKTLKEHIDSSPTEMDKFALKRVAMDKKVTRVLLIALFLFIATYLPASIFICLLQYIKQDVEHCPFRHVFRDLSFLFIASNSCMNPFVYAIRLKPFRESISVLLKCKSVKVGRESTSNIPSNERRKNYLDK